ncbi:MAG: class I mannose-6-phosphate isomerase, partial [Planctomycetaceae bacterium]|nr:class I mannose-6-phosphate isomerase [Planctomycetaceae bacterium]
RPHDPPLAQPILLLFPFPIPIAPEFSGMRPLVFRPILKRIRWGGRRLGDLLGKPIGPESDYAESWEVVDHGSDQSVVTTGRHRGESLRSLVERQNVPLFGRHAGLSQFPLLVKFLDAGDVLSVQVHPDDALATKYDPSENGKTEAWVILDAAPGSLLYVGFQSGVTAVDLRHALARGAVDRLLHRFSVTAGDCIFVPAGTVHAIGAGVLLAEVQQSSDLTFRLDDWGRVDRDGRPRELHIEQALDCIDFQRGPVNPLTPILLESDHQLEQLICCDQFQMLRRRADRPFVLPDDDTCRILLTLSGSGRLSCDAETFDLTCGQTVLLPAHRPPVVIHPDEEVTLLEASLP